MGVGEGKQRERGYSCRAITVAEVQTSREFERRPVAVRASTTTRRARLSVKAEDRFYLTHSTLALHLVVSVLVRIIGLAEKCFGADVSVVLARVKENDFDDEKGA